jgi:hypothetical protein
VLGIGPKVWLPSRLARDDGPPDGQGPPPEAPGDAEVAAYSTGR